MRNLDAETAYVGSTEIKEVRLGEQLVLAPNGDTLWYTANEVPSLDLRFADSKSLVDATTGTNLIDFTRASSGTYVGSDGLIKTATTNLLLQSEDFSTTWITSNASVTVNDTAAPDGSITADKVVVSSPGLSVRQEVSGSFAAGSTYIVSAWVKADGSDIGKVLKIGLRRADATALQQAYSEVVLTGDWQRISQSITWSVARTAISFDIRTDAVSGIAASNFYIWGAQLEQSSTVGEYVKTTSTINSAPRFDHDPTTGESLGLLVEESRVNSLSNSTAQGAVAGVPGTVPTGWSITSASNGLNPEIVATGTEDGINYVDIRYSGTTTASGQFSILPSTVTAITAATGQSWTGSAYVKLQAGSLSGLTNTLLSVNGRSSVGAGLESTSTIFTPSNSALRLQRQTASITLANASTARISMTAFAANYSSGVAIDITLRIGLPQLEQGAFATSVIPTSGTAATRAADVPTDTTSGAAIRSLYAQFRSPASGTRPVVSLDDDTANERIELFTSGTDPKLLVTDGGSTQADLDAGSITANTTARLAARFNTDNFAASVSGGAEVADTTGTMPTVNRVRIGRDQAGNCLNGTIARITGWDSPLPLLPTITQ